MEKHEEYAAKVLGCLAGLFDEDSENQIDPEELEDNMTELIHAISNMAPTVLYNKITGDNLDNLAFNHIANRLVFQFSKMDK